MDDFSRTIMKGCDVNKNGRISRKERKFSIITLELYFLFFRNWRWSWWQLMIRNTVSSKWMAELTIRLQLYSTLNEIFSIFRTFCFSKNFYVLYRDFYILLICIYIYIILLSAFLDKIYWAVFCFGYLLRIMINKSRLTL